MINQTAILKATTVSMTTNARIIIVALRINVLLHFRSTLNATRCLIVTVDVVIAINAASHAQMESLVSPIQLVYLLYVMSTADVWVLFRSLYLLGTGFS